MPARAQSVGAAERLTTVERARLVAEVLATYAIVRRRLRRTDLPAVLAALRTPARRGAGRFPSPTTSAASPVPPCGSCRALPSDARCLTRSLVVLAMLARRGSAATLVIATRPEPSFTAHAWVEYAGRPLLPTEGFGDVRLVEL